jgi:hypothetical protein
MAEIRSTLDMVLERAAKMAAASTHTSTDEDSSKIGMRLAADFLKNNGEENLRAKLQEQKPEQQRAVMKGMAETLLRNVVLPRDERLRETGELALKAIAELAPGEGATICKELVQILNQYKQHKEQLQQQLDDAIRAQLEQKMTEQGRDAGRNIAINPAMHPQYQEEMGRMLTGLNQQYNQALDQRKMLLREKLTPAG